jgi:hypothetical protein
MDKVIKKTLISLGAKVTESPNYDTILFRGKLSRKVDELRKKAGIDKYGNKIKE